MRSIRSVSNLRLGWWLMFGCASRYACATLLYGMFVIWLYAAISLQGSETQTRWHQESLDFR